MRRLIYCPCGCGELRRKPLPPRAERLRRRRFHAEQAAKAIEAITRHLQSARAHALGLDQPPQQETVH